METLDQFWESMDRFREFALEFMRLRNEHDSQTDPHKRLRLNDFEVAEC